MANDPAGDSAGDAQSPIDIRSGEVAHVALPEVRTHYGPVGLQIVDTGAPDPEATVRADVAGEASVEADGATYRLQQFHFHAPAEHLVDGERHPMEVHLVHESDDGVTLVIALFVAEGTGHGELSKVLGHHRPGPVTDRDPESFDLGLLLPGDRRSYRYDGSLTTPPFTEGVRWVILVEPIELSSEQITAFRDLFPDGNAREVQPLGDRRIFTDVPRG